MKLYLRWILIGLGAGMSVSGCGPDTEALKSEIKAELKTELEAAFDAKLKTELDAAVQARVKEQLASYRVSGASAGAVGRENDVSEASGMAEPVLPEPSGHPEPVVPGEPGEATTEPVASKVISTDSQGLILKRLVAAPGLIGREPSEARTAFTLKDEKVHCFMEFRNKGGPERKVTVIWTRNGKEFHRHSLDVRKDASRHRTYAHARIDPKRLGDWTCAVENEAGKRLGTVAFTVGGKASP